MKEKLFIAKCFLQRSLDMVVYNMDKVQGHNNLGFRYIY